MPCFKVSHNYFSDTLVLPLNRPTDHVIPLQPGVSAINVKAYRYGYYQKGETKKLVAKMLAAGIIKPSSSPFSSLVLLKKRWKLEILC